MRIANRGLSRWVLGFGMTTVLIAGCATTSNTATGRWQSPKTRTEPFESVLLVAVAKRDDARRAFEATLANAISSSGSARATTTYDSILISNLSKEAIVNLAERANADAVLVTRIIGQSVQAGSMADEVITHWGPAVSVSHNEDSSMTTVVSSNRWTDVVPGAATLETDNVLETSIYEPRTGDRLVYRATMKAQFEIGPNQTAEMGAAVLAQELVRQLRKDRVIR